MSYLICHKSNYDTFIHTVIIIHLCLTQQFWKMGFIFLFSVNKDPNCNDAGDFSQRAFNRKRDNAENVKA